MTVVLGSDSQYGCLVIEARDYTHREVVVARAALRRVDAETQESQRIYREVMRQASTMDDAFLRCRAGSHSFTVPLTARKMRGGYEERFACKNECGVERYRELNTYGLVIRYNLDYSKAKGYLLKGTGRLTGYGKGAMRVANITRVIETLEGSK